MFNGKQQPKPYKTSVPTQFLSKKPMSHGPKYTNVESDKFFTTPLAKLLYPPPLAQKYQHNPTNKVAHYKPS